ncbi:DUF3379 domain-containing protein [Shewanella sp. D64]|uniref:DUF3379 domain-containing protein n=1 Tax=unclassified Shewanella TaxID=196818 RepID=UPI0022BA1EAE|nr:MULTISPECIES: DUF3379 domain-containing protein [unclassified Shewanella]MEC4728907.1 DUF3379 domain-containing protein [Shewanella sp. D64]MEC4740781.1 DUF3379 domain-containing protein [Shewanella sp. E94]WBJ97384.1 DUF3379 domain-containing protein [Shewanella sp. MTB7]
MDELKFRRQAYGDPNSQDPDFLSEMHNSVEQEAFVNDLKKLDCKIERALNIDVPEDLAAKLLLNQQLHQHQYQRRRSGFTLAMVASVAFIAGISFTLLRMAPVDLGQHALAHVYHETKAMEADNNVKYSDVNFQLASLGTLGNSHFTQQPGKVYYSTFCDFQGVQSLHLVMQGEHSKVTLFIVPVEHRMVLEAAFADNKYKGNGFVKDNAYMLLVGETSEDINFVKKEVEQTFI